MLANKTPIAFYAAMPNAIPNTTKWLVVPCRADNSPVRVSRNEWMVVAEFDTFEAAEAEAEHYNRLLTMVCQ